MTAVAILGASGGIGTALCKLLAQRPDISVIHATYHESSQATAAQGASDGEASAGVRIVWSRVNATDERAVCAWVESLGTVDWLINCVGMLHNSSHGPEKSIRVFDPEHFQRSMSVNCLPTLLLGKYARNALKASQQPVFATISARVGSIEDNHLGGWYSYRASKAALNMSLKCLAIEWFRLSPKIRVAALHPGTTDSRLSKPFQQHVPKAQLFSSDKTASLLIEQIEQLHDRASGQFIAYDGEVIPW